MSDPAGAKPMIEVRGLEVRYGDVPAVNGVSFGVGRGELLTLLGPSGCGKTTTLRAIAGLEQPCGGSIALDGTVVYSAAARRNVATEKRGVSMVFQSYAIWPHMNVFENVAYGLRVRKLPRAEVEGKVQHALDLVQMQDYAARPASKLSGGQQQRVAVARAIAFSPAIVLFDEPLSNLDAKLRAEMRVELRALQNRLSFTSVYVTHDQEEALTISDRVIVMNAGRIEQIGSPQDICDRPRNRFVADFVGSANSHLRPGPAGLGRERHRGLRHRGRSVAAGRHAARRLRRRGHGGVASLLHLCRLADGQCRRERCPRAHRAPYLPWRLHRIRGERALGPADRPPTADRDHRAGRRCRDLVRPGALRAAAEGAASVDPTRLDLI